MVVSAAGTPQVQERVVMETVTTTVERIKYTVTDRELLPPAPPKRRHLDTDTEHRKLYEHTHTLAWTPTTSVFSRDVGRFLPSVCVCVCARRVDSEIPDLLSCLTRWKTSAQSLSSRDPHDFTKRLQVINVKRAPLLILCSASATADWLRAVNMFHVHVSRAWRRSLQTKSSE